MKEIRELVEKYSHVALEAAIDQHIREGTNPCFTGETDEETMAILSKASFVRKLMDEGKADSVTDGIRQLAGSIRSLGKAT